MLMNDSHKLIACYRLLLQQVRGSVMHDLQIPGNNLLGLLVRLTDYGQYLTIDLGRCL